MFEIPQIKLQLTNPVEEQNAAGDHILASFQTCKSLCLQFSSIVDCALQLIDTIEWIISGQLNKYLEMFSKIIQ